MSRFEEVVGEAIDEVVLGEALPGRDARRPHRRARARAPGRPARRGRRSRRATRRPSAPRSPASQTQEIYTLFGTAVASERGTRTLTGVQAQGMTACPCAQEMVAEPRPRAPRRATGFDAEEIERVIEAVPVATHNQRGIGTLYVGCPEGGASDSTRRELLRIVEQSMSSEIYELMKRPDELAVVEKAHAQPRFVEDCVREMVRRVAEAYPDLPDEAFVMARQENLETIHRHNVVAERYGPLDDLRARARQRRALAPPPDDARVARGALRLAGARGLAPPAASPGAPRPPRSAAEAEEVVGAADHRHRDRGVDEHVDPERRRVARRSARTPRRSAAPSSPCRASSPRSRRPARPAIARSP